MSESDSFEATYAIKTDNVVNEELIKKCLPITQILRFEIDSPNKMVNIDSNIAPSNIIKAFQNHGMDAILRGSGKPNSSAVCILEDFKHIKVNGLVRIIQVKDKKTVFDITANGLSPGSYQLMINENGDISNGIRSTGNPFYKFSETLNSKTITEEHQLYLSAPLQIQDLIGRSFVIKSEHYTTNDVAIGGIIAKSAGVWENDKVVCACTGKSVWEERKDAKEIGIN